MNSNHRHQISPAPGAGARLYEPQRPWQPGGASNSSGGGRGAEPLRVADSRSGANRFGGFTLPELMIAITVFLLVLAAVISANVFGLSIFQIAQNKLSAADSTRVTVGKLTDEIRNCNSAYVGNVTNGTFYALANGQAQAGQGLLIYPTTNTANFVIYFLNLPDQTFRRTTSVANSTSILAHSVTNNIAFSAQDCLGNVLTNSQNNRVIQLDLVFYQPARFGVVPDYYRIQTAATRRAL